MSCHRGVNVVKAATLRRNGGEDTAAASVPRPDHYRTADSSESHIACTVPSTRALAA
jgi:hypothetical protein